MSEKSALVRFGNRLAERDGGWQCHYCKAPLVPLGKDSEYCEMYFDGENWGYIQGEYLFPTVDHIVPKSKGGLTVMDNLVLACGRCNCLKGTKDYVVFIAGLS